jgi:hypothetical protein
MSQSIPDDLYRLAERGDLQAITELVEILKELGTPQAKALSLWWQGRALLVDVERLENFSQESGPAGSLDIRTQASSMVQSGQSLPDALIRTAGCPECGGADKPAIQFFEGTYYTDLFGFIGHALMACAASNLIEKPNKCRKCRLPMQLMFADYHSRHFDRQKDLVLRCFYSGFGTYGLSYGLLWWAGGSDYSAISHNQISEEESCAQLLERAVLLLQAHERAWGLAVIRRAMTQYSGDPLLLECVSLLDRDNERGIVDSIVSGHLAKYPDDPSAHYWMSKLLIQAYIESLGPPQLLTEATEHIERALSNRPGWQEAELIDCLIGRLKNEDGTALRSKYDGLLQKYPDYPDLYYDYALFAMENNPAEALSLFAQGSALQPDDPEFVVGKARALLLMGKKNEANIEFAKAKRMGEKHPGVLKAERNFAPVPRTS